MEATSVTSKGQVTIPRVIRDRLGIRRGTLVEFSIVESRVELKVRGLSAGSFKSCFAKLKSSKPAVAVNFADAYHHASYLSCQSVASFDDKKFARRAKVQGLKPDVNVPT